MMNKLKWLVLTAMLFSNSTFAQSIQLNQVYSLDSKTAQMLVQEAESTCKKLNHNIAVVVVDQGGNPLIAHRHESVGPHNLAAAEKKAYTALSTKTSTMLLSQTANENSDAKNLTTLSNLLLLGGGLPIRYENQVVGAIGVAGAGGAKNDNHCAASAIQATLNY
ncbi:heme-degrading [compost metagenome]